MQLEAYVPKVVSLVVTVCAEATPDARIYRCQIFT
jgi:hypothetical protein